ncbi:hypothetical protein PROFUN_03790 [Planoprotostelium fungivorum]|uniref:Protein kinase domain-containing protein n=1 Tax=Planoprotostelium fungivorum TaxID=1890364 RepID=A0A2P6NDS8_9EUKA|nr:hypothetical protein PROFUN_03790 [Planoprotostelium fungivorum]
MLSAGLTIKGKWKITRKIGQGAFGEIYQAKNTQSGDDVALKVEKVDIKKQVLKLEVAVLKKLQECPHVCRFITCGRYAEFNYLAMELLGENLSELRRKQPDGCFSMGTTLKLGEQLLRVIQAMHDLGYLHRDIKPSNFAMGLGPKKRNVFVIDFGLSRRFLLPDGEVRPPRDSTGFRGTARYASIFSHQGQDLGRRDDLWSLFYVLVEMTKGQLPWRKLKEKEQIGEMKQKITQAELCHGLPAEFLTFALYLQGLEFLTRPDYDYLYNLLTSMLSREKGEKNLYDWEVATAGTISSDPPSHLAVTSAGTVSQMSNTKMSNPTAPGQRPYSRGSGSQISPKPMRNILENRNRDGGSHGEGGDQPKDDSYSDSGRRPQTYNTSDAVLSREKTQKDNGNNIRPTKPPQGSDDTASESEDHSDMNEKTKEDVFATPPVGRKNNNDKRLGNGKSSGLRMQPLNITEQTDKGPVTSQPQTQSVERIEPIVQPIKTTSTFSSGAPALTDATTKNVAGESAGTRTKRGRREREKKSGGCCVLQ